MRLDKYLKVSRLIKRRTVANDACDAARITVNGKPAKASYQVKIGDVIEIAFGQRTMKVEVLNIAEHTLKADASALYKELKTEHNVSRSRIYCRVGYFFAVRRGVIWRRRNEAVKCRTVSFWRGERS